MSERRRHLTAEGKPIAMRLRHLVHLLWALLLMVCVIAVGVLQMQANQVNRLTVAIGPAFDANGQVLHAMVDAETGLRAFQASHEPELLTQYVGARARTMEALATVHEKLLLATGDDAEAALHAGLEGNQSLAVQRWWTYALSTEQAVTRGARTDAEQGRDLFDGFRRANTALGDHITTERDQSRVAAQTASGVGTVASISATVLALVAALVLGRRAAGSLSRPMTELRDTMTRQREGDSGARAREDQGSLELRSLAADFNALTAKNLGLQQSQALGLSMNKLAFEIARAIRVTSGTQQALDVLCVALGEGLGVDRVMAKTIEADRRLLFAQWHLPVLPPLGEAPRDVALAVGQAGEEPWRSIERLALDDFLAPQVQSEERNRIFYRETGARAVIVAPVGLGDRMIGVIYALTVDQPRGWTEPEVSTVQQVAGFVARAIVEADHRAHQGEYVDRLERLDRQKTDFLATVSHELRTPLTSISGYLEMLQDRDAGDLTVEQAQILEVMDRNTSRLGGLIEDLLVLNRIESGHLKIDADGVSVPELITHAGHELSPFAQRGAIELDIDAGPEAAIVQGDKGSLDRAIINIVSNAIKFSRPGGVVTISCRLDEGARRVILSCRDRGIGIPADDQVHLFTRFYRASNATAQAIPGTGLGLSIVKQIIDDHEGELRLSSVEGDGTEVVIELPWSARARASAGAGNDSHSGDVFGLRA